MVIDFHVHYFPDNVASAAVEKLQSLSGFKFESDGTLSSLERSMEASGVTLSVNMPVATKPEQTESINRSILRPVSDRVISFAAIHPSNDRPVEILERMRDAGLKGIKNHKLK